MINVFEEDYIRRWRVLAMLQNIKRHMNDSHLPDIIDNYLKFVKTIDEKEWEEKTKKEIYLTSNEEIFLREYTCEWSK